MEARRMKQIEMRDAFLKDLYELMKKHEISAISTSMHYDCVEIEIEFADRSWGSIDIPSFIAPD